MTTDPGSPIGPTDRDRDLTVTEFGYEDPDGNIVPVGTGVAVLKSLFGRRIFVRKITGTTPVVGRSRLTGAQMLLRDGRPLHVTHEGEWEQVS